MNRPLSKYLRAERAKQKAIFDRRENWILFASASIGYGVLLYLGEPQKWLVAWGTTLLIFVVTIGRFHNRWQSSGFWVAISTALTIHLALVWSIFSVILRSSDDVSFILCVPFILLEGGLIYYFVRRFGDPRLLRTDDKEG